MGMNTAIAQKPALRSQNRPVKVTVPLPEFEPEAVLQETAPKRLDRFEKQMVKPVKSRLQTAKSSVQKGAYAFANGFHSVAKHPYTAHAAKAGVVVLGTGVAAYSGKQLLGNTALIATAKEATKQNYAWGTKYAHDAFQASYKSAKQLTSDLVYNLVYNSPEHAARTLVGPFTKALVDHILPTPITNWIAHRQLQNIVGGYASQKGYTTVFKLARNVFPFYSLWTNKYALFVQAPQYLWPPARARLLAARRAAAGGI